MKERLANILVRVRSSLWLIPVTVAAASFALAYYLLSSGLAFSTGVIDDMWWLFGGDADTARDLLSTLLSGMITMTSLVVSITMVVLSLGAGQLGPRLIWIFIRDRQIQGVLGLFIGTIVYLLVILRSVDGDLGEGGVPHIAITVGSVLTLACLFALLFHVHKVSRLIISDVVVRMVAESLYGAIGRLPMKDGSPVASGGAVVLPREEAVALGTSGYVQVVDYGALCRLARDHDLLLDVDVRAGHFVLAEGAAVRAHAARPLDDEVLSGIRDAFVVGGGRTPSQDLEYSIRQLVEIAVRALSPGINDPFTAIAVVHRLGAALSMIDRHVLPLEEHVDGEGRLRVRAVTTTHQGLVDAAFNQIRQAAAGHASVLIAMAQIFAELAQVVESQPLRAALRHQAGAIDRAGRGLPEPIDREAFASTIDPALESLGAMGGESRP
jgi:uncharacterized membrane protein